MSARDLIVAPATPTGRSALAIVRLSGTVDAVLGRVVVPLRDGPWRPGRTRRVALRDDDGVFDDGVAVLARGPRSYTGEDTLELGVHGNPLVVDRLLRACVDAGARLAEPGELTRRAVEHGRIDLLEAEAIDQAIRAATPAGLAIARQALGGALGAAIRELRGALLAATAELEARVDHPGEDLVLQSDAELVEVLEGVAARSRALAATHAAGRRWVEGARVALVGAVNAGKSSLFNALLGRARALVHERPGTTRDVVEARLALGGLEVTLLDTAGERATDDPVEAAGLALARELVADADVLVVVLRAAPAGPDDAERRILARTAERARIVVWNGVDRAGVAPAPAGALATSAVQGHGVEALRARLTELLTGGTADGLAIASVRQRDLLLAVADRVDEALEALPIAGDVVAADALIEAVGEIDVLTGADTREAVLDAVFARFCIGK